jgi:hypothetical protein
MAAIAVPVAFLAKDQIRCGLLRAEQTVAIGLFAVSSSSSVTGAAGLPLAGCSARALNGGYASSVILRRLVGEDTRGKHSDFTLHFRKFEISPG